MFSKKIKIFLIIVLFVILILLSRNYFNLELVKLHLNQLVELNSRNPFIFKIIFILFYTITVTLSLPVATILTLLSGYLFGSMIGTLISLFSASVGAIGAIILVKFFFSDFFRKKYSKKFSEIDKFMTDYSLTTLLSLRLSPLFPYFITNAFLGLIRVSLRDVFISSFIGKFPILFLLSSFGRKFSEIQSLDNLISWDFFFLTLGLSFLPWISNWLVRKIKQ